MGLLQSWACDFIEPEGADTKFWEEAVSPGDIGYERVENWLKLPDDVLHPTGSDVAIDSQGRIYIADRGNPGPASIIVVNNDGEFLDQWKTEGLLIPHMICCDSNDNIWVTDQGTHQIYKLNDQGEIIFRLGEKGVSGSGQHTFDKPTDVEFFADGSCLVADGYGVNKRILKYDADFNFLAQWGATKSDEPGQFAVPHDVLIGSDGLVYVSDRDAWRVQVFNADGKLLKLWPHIGQVFDLAESSDHNFYFLDGNTGQLTGVDKDGKMIGFIRSPDLKRGHGMAITSEDDLILAIKDGRIEKYRRSDTTQRQK